MPDRKGRLLMLQTPRRNRLIPLVSGACVMLGWTPAFAQNATTYTNPLAPVIPAGGGVVESCADPSIIKGQTPDDDRWYMYCTTDPLNGGDLDATGAQVFHRIPQMRSSDLVNWEYVGDAFPQGAEGLPDYAGADAALWAPDIVYSSMDNGDGDGQYLLLFVVTDTTDATSGEAGCPGDSAIGVATSESPVGPWTFARAPVVPPRRGNQGCDFKWTFDPDVLGDRIEADGTLYYGSYYGGIQAVPMTLEVDGATSSPDAVRVDQAATTMVAIDNRYEGANVILRDGWYYIFVSATDCCNGALTGYTTFVGRSKSPVGPFVDRQGVALRDAAAGGTPLLAMNGNRWVGPGHNTVFQDDKGGWWTVYHAVDRRDPFFPGVIPSGERGFTKRPALLDAIIWTDGWPRVEGGPSDQERPAPSAAQIAPTAPEDRTAEHRPGALLAEYSDDFDGDSLGSAWGWSGGDGTALPVHGIAGGVLRIAVQTGDTYVDANTARVLVRDAPDQNFLVETRLQVDVPDTGCCYNFAQAGAGIYGDQDNLLKLTVTSIFNTRQTEWAKEVGAAQVPAGWARYGNSVVGPPANDWTYLRIAVERAEAAEGETYLYTAYTSRDGRDWVRGGTWTHDIADPRIAIFAMGRQPATEGPAFTAEFDYVRTYALP